MRERAASIGATLSVTSAQGMGTDVLLVAASRRITMSLDRSLAPPWLHAGLGPAPFCCMLLSDMGATVTRIDRPGTVYKAADVEARGPWLDWAYASVTVSA